MNISIGNDHAGTIYKRELLHHLQALGHTITNHGTDEEGRVDYPDTVHPVAKDVASQKSEIGIIICGSGNGANMTANKHQNVRSALCWTKEIVALAREHNNANMISLGERQITKEMAIKIVDIWLNSSFEGGRHKKRIEV